MTNDIESLDQILVHWRMVYGFSKNQIDQVRKRAAFNNGKLIYLTLPQMFKEIPEEILDFRSLQTLRINKLTSIERMLEILSRLPSLRSLSIRSSSNKTVLEAMKLKNIHTLDGSFSNIQDFPIPEEQSMLRTLILAGNPISHIPDIGTHYPVLHTLDLSFTPIEHISKSILSFQKLRDLKLWASNLEKIDPEIIEQLIRLDISSTPLSKGDLSNIDFKHTKVIVHQSDRFR